MRFSRHLSSHLTPEWRKQYIQYAELKKLVYGIVGSKKRLLLGRPHNREEAEPVDITVDTALQEDFFDKIFSQIDSINHFFRREESTLLFSFSEIEEQVEQLGSLSTRKAVIQRRTMKRALSEFYYNLVLLQNFQQLNQTGFRKILKKHDKLTYSSRGKKMFKENVCTAYFVVSDNVTRMITDVEKIMIQVLEEGDRSRAMNRLRVPPLGKADKRSHWATYFAGFTSALVVLSIAVNAIAVSQWPENWYTSDTQPVLRAFRAGLLLTVWFWGFAVNTYGWRYSGVNNVLIFEFDPRNYLNFIQLFQVAGLVASIWMVGVYLSAFSPWLGIPVYVGPLVMYGLILFCVFLPLPILYYRSRLWMLRTLGRILCAPFFDVRFADFWLADQLTSLTLTMLDTEFFFCYMFYGMHSSEDSPITCGSGSYGLRLIVAALPAWWRFAQCMRRYYDTRSVNPHLVNAGKYSTAFFVAIFSAVAAVLIDRSLDISDQATVYKAFFGLWIISAVVATSYTFSWDILMDWSLFPNIPQSCGKLSALKLRDDIIYSYRFYYFLALVENFIFRIFWIFNISVGHVLGIIPDDLIVTISGVVEIVRRVVWNFFRVENEHVNNVGQFRAVRDIALYPLDLGRVDVDADLEDEKEKKEDAPFQAHISRRMSKTLLDLGDRKVITSLKQRKGDNTNTDAEREGQLPDIPEEDNQANLTDNAIQVSPLLLAESSV